MYKCKCRLDASVFNNNVEMMINVDPNVKTGLIKVYVTEDIFGILATVSLNVINCVMLGSTYTIKIISVEKGW